MSVLGQPRVHHHKYKFVVEIDNVSSAFFQSATGLEAEFEDVEYSEGGTLVADKSPGRMNFGDVTLTRGAVTEDEDLYTWFVQTAEAAANAGLAEPLFRRTLDIVQLDRTDTEVRRWRLFGAYPKKFVPGDWDNEASEVSMEQVVLRIQWFELV